MKDLARKEILKMMPYVPGKPIDDVKRESSDRVIASVELTYSRIKEIEHKYIVVER